MTPRTPDEELDEESTPDGEVPAGLDLVDPLVMSEDTYDDEGTGGLSFSDAPIDDETPVDELVGLVADGGADGIDVTDEPDGDDTTLPPEAEGIDLDDADTPTDDPLAEEGLDEGITLPPDPDDLDDA